MDPYYTDGQVTLYLADALTTDVWLAADVMVTDPPYGIGWKQGDTIAGDSRLRAPVNQRSSNRHDGIHGDLDTTTRDAALTMWGDRPALLFGSLRLAPPPGTKLVGVFDKGPSRGFRGGVGGFRPNAEAFYLVGRGWPTQLGGRSCVVTPRGMAGGQLARRTGHPHTKPVDVMELLISHCPPGVIVDPFAGSGSTLVAARNQGRSAVGVEVEERHCETAARRLSQGTLFTTGPPAPTPAPALPGGAARQQHVTLSDHTSGH